MKLSYKTDYPIPINLALEPEHESILVEPFTYDSMIVKEIIISHEDGIVCLYSKVNSFTGIGIKLSDLKDCEIYRR